MEEALGVGLLGLGVVGRGVLEALQRNARAYEARGGRRLEVRAAAVRNVAARAELAAAGLSVVADPRAVATRPDIDLVVELMGGEEPATGCIEAALSAGKSVVTANKEVMAKSGPALLKLAEACGAELRYEASVGGGIPIIGVLQRDLQANEVSSVRAIINGTTNYMITAMSRDGMSYEDALADAQRLGYAEADPTNDVDGIDAAYKLAILASLAFHSQIGPEDVHCEGIRLLTARDFFHARNLGYSIRMLATARQTPLGLDLRVHPTLVPTEDPMAGVEGVLNAVSVSGEPIGSVVLEGPGAGAGATSSAVVADILEVAGRLVSGQTPRRLRQIDQSPRFASLADIHVRTYLRLEVPDRAGVLAELGAAFAAEGVSIASVLQTPHPERSQSADLIVTTHACSDGALDRVLQGLDRSDSEIELGVRIRIEDGCDND
ncbi:MAG: homoserine dehydrogenase [Chloroflexota bacterium]|nr:homoserine dehydrogenase [Chloroflexota bacterium]